jgi:hypothetical protein
MEVKGGGRALDLWVKVVFFSLPFSCFESQTERERQEGRVQGERGFVIGGFGQSLT